MIKWFHHLLNPHCEHCLAERELDEHCKACDILQYEVERLRAENERLLARILHIPEPTPERSIAPELVSSRPRASTWAMRKQILEAEDREKAKLMSKVPVAKETQDLEDELLNAEVKREAQK